MLFRTILTSGIASRNDFQRCVHFAELVLFAPCVWQKGDEPAKSARDTPLKADGGFSVAVVRPLSIAEHRIEPAHHAGR